MIPVPWMCQSAHLKSTELYLWDPLKKQFMRTLLTPVTYRLLPSATDTFLDTL